LIVKHGLKTAFHHFVWLMIKGGLHFLFLGDDTVFPWLCFFYQTLFLCYILYSIMCTSVTGGIMMNKRQL